jgi:hypothetical protein
MSGWPACGASAARQSTGRGSILAWRCRWGCLHDHSYSLAFSIVLFARQTAGLHQDCLLLRDLLSSLFASRSHCKCSKLKGCRRRLRCALSTERLAALRPLPRWASQSEAYSPSPRSTVGSDPCELDGGQGQRRVAGAGQSCAWDTRRHLLMADSMGNRLPWSGAECLLGAPVQRGIEWPVDCRATLFIFSEDGTDQASTTD